MFNLNFLKQHFRNKKVLITGHTGFKGSWLAFLLKEMGADDKSGTFDMFSMVKNTMASGKADVNAVVASFNKFLSPGFIRSGL